MSGDPYPYSVDEIANFHEDMADLLSDITERSREDLICFELTSPHVPTIDGAANRYFEREIWMEGAAEHWTAYDYTVFRSDIDDLVDRLERFVDDARLSNFDEVSQKLYDVKELLEEAVGADAGMQAVDIALAGWVSGAAVNFRDVVIQPFGRVLLRQANLAKEIAIAALGYKAIIEHARADSLDLASQLQKKLSGGGGGVSLDAVLFVTGAVASGVALAASSPVSWPAVIAWGAGTARGIDAITEEEAAEYAVDGIAAEASSESDERAIAGRFPQEFVQSTRDEVLKIWQAAFDQEQAIRDGLNADLANLRDEDLSLEIPEPELATAETPADLGLRADVHIEDVVELKRVGLRHLPAVAQVLYEALLKVASVRGAFDAAFQDSRLAGTYRWTFDQACEKLADALTQTRDFLYESGLRLSLIADGYYESDQAIRDEFDRLVDDDGVPDDFEGTPDEFTFDDLVDLHLEDFPRETYRPAPTGYY